MKIAKLAGLFAAAAFLLFAVFSASEPRTLASADDPSELIEGYKTWTKITNEAIKVEREFQVFGWGIAIDSSSMEFMRNSSVMPRSRTSGGNTTIMTQAREIPKPTPKPTPDVTDAHKEWGVTYGMVFANELANREFKKQTPQFAVGSIIVREKLSTADSVKPDYIIAMVKRDPGFSKETGDWEFFVFDGPTLQLKNREKKGSCAECHAAAKGTDWVFRKYLNETEIGR